MGGGERGRGGEGGYDIALKSSHTPRSIPIPHPTTPPPHHPTTPLMTQATIGIIMGSDSDLPTMQGAIAVCEEFEVPYEVAIVSAHRTPERMVDYAKQAHLRGLKVIIAGAGGAAHLPGMVAALTPLPVIGVPVASRHLQGVDSLYSIVQMPAGIPVATVAIGNAKNAGLLAVQILASHQPELLKKVQQYRQDLNNLVMDKQARLDEIGYRQYLAES
jgi:5-(carboxyamino)imidazole ribonucleotide mutase